MRSLTLMSDFVNLSTELPEYPNIANATLLTCGGWGWGWGGLGVNLQFASDYGFVTDPRVYRPAPPKEVGYG